jgi:hypothetical protein
MNEREALSVQIPHASELRQDLRFPLSPGSCGWAVLWPARQASSGCLPAKRYATRLRERVLGVRCGASYRVKFTQR